MLTARYPSKALLWGRPSLSHHFQGWGSYVISTMLCLTHPYCYAFYGSPRDLFWADPLVLVCLCRPSGTLWSDSLLSASSPLKNIMVGGLSPQRTLWRTHSSQKCCGWSTPLLASVESFGAWCPALFQPSSLSGEDVSRPDKEIPSCLYCGNQWVISGCPLGSPRSVYPSRGLLTHWAGYPENPLAKVHTAYLCAVIARGWWASSLSYTSA